MDTDELQRLSVVETQVGGMDKKLDSIDRKVDALTSRFDKLDGGKKAVWLMSTAVAGLIGYFASYFKPHG